MRKCTASFSAGCRIPDHGKIKNAPPQGSSGGAALFAVPVSHPEEPAFEEKRYYEKEV